MIALYLYDFVAACQEQIAILIFTAQLTRASAAEQVEPANSHSAW